MQEVTLIVPDSVQRPAAISLRERQLLDMQEMLIERLAALELGLEDAGWEQVGTSLQREFSRAGLQKIIDRARLMYLSNPLIGRAVDVQANYVFGQGVEFEAEDPDVNEVVQDFLADPKNRAEFSSHQAMTGKEVDLSVEGNVFFVFFVDPAKGKVQVRTLPVNEITEIICNPDDMKEPWFYRRQWTQMSLAGRAEGREALYPDYQYNPRSKRSRIGKADILWDTPVQHVKIGGVSAMRFGIPETYRAHDWARAYKEALEDRATFTRALTRFAQKLTMQTSASGIAAAKERLGTTAGAGAERNPPPLVGSTFIGRKDKDGNVIADMEPVKLGGATIPTDNERVFRLQVAAAMGLPETFFGDADVGNHATSKTLDRPTELMMVQRRNVWSDVYSDMLSFVVRKAVQAPGGPLRATYRVVGNVDDQPYQVVGKQRRDGEIVAATVSIVFPDLLEHDLEATVKAIVASAEYLGEQLVARLLLSALSVKEIDEKITEWFGSQPDQIPEPPAPTQPAPSDGRDEFTEAVRDLRDQIRHL